MIGAFDPKLDKRLLGAAPTSLFQCLKYQFREKWLPVKDIIPVNEQGKAKRLANWDLLRSISMFAVVVVHMGGYLGPIGGVSTGAISIFAIICDPIFFTLSGYFALRPMKAELPLYYIRKFSSIVLPLFLYSLILYTYCSWSSGLSVVGYIEYFHNVLSPWWFIPALIPFLIIAPVLYTCLNALSDDWAKRILKIGLLLALWGVIGCFLSWVFDFTGHATLGRIARISATLMPATLVPNSYFIYFCLGYFVRRVIPMLSGKQKSQLVALGLVCWMLDVIFGHFGINRVDPSYAWLPATVAIFILFDRLAVPDGIVSKMASWAAKRSYSIYLLQYTTIEVAVSLVYKSLFNEGIMAYPVSMRIAVWLGVTVFSYCLALGVSSVIDSFLLEPLKRAFNSVAVKLICKPCES